MSKNKGGASNLKRLKDEIEQCIKTKNYEKARNLSNKLIELSPKSPYGYEAYMRALTHTYKKYIDDDEKIKKLKDMYDKAYDLSSKAEKKELKIVVDEYLHDIKEVDNLEKIKTELTSKYVLKNMYHNALSSINQRLGNVNYYSKDGKRITSLYDFIRGLFYVFCLIYNLTSFNYLLLLTVPFGIFGIISVISFIEMNFFNKGKYKIEKQTYDKMVEEDNEKILIIKSEIKKLNEVIEFTKTQKMESINKLPHSFHNSISKIMANDENVKAIHIADLLTTNNTLKLSYEVDKYTNLNTDELTKKFNELTLNVEMEKFINAKKDERKRNGKEAMLMKNIKPSNVVALVIMLLISLSSSIILFNNFYEMNLVAFIIAIVVGILSALSYNIITGKHASISDTFNDNLLSAIFNGVLVYDIIYYKTTSSLTITYGFLQIPITLILVLIGFVYLISFVKYVYLIKRLRK